MFFIDESVAFHENNHLALNPICTGGFGLFLSTGGADMPPLSKIFKVKKHQCLISTIRGKTTNIVNGPVINHHYRWKSLKTHRTTSCPYSLSFKENLIPKTLLHTIWTELMSKVLFMKSFIFLYNTKIFLSLCFLSLHTLVK